MNYTDCVPCVKCQAPIKFKTLVFGSKPERTIPYNPDGTKHSTTCKKIRQAAKSIYESL